jgi:hypothetical protein
MWWSKCYLVSVCDPLKTKRNVGVLLTWAFVVLLFAGKKAEQLPFRLTHIPPADSPSLHGGERRICEGGSIGMA